MPVPPRSAKQVAERYKGNIDYLRKPHFSRLLRGFCFLVAVVGSIAVALGFRHFGGKQSFYNTGPLSANHAQFADRCEVCHEGARPDLAEVLRLDKAMAGAHQVKLPSAEELKQKVGEALPTVADKATSLAKSAAGQLDPAHAQKAFDGLVQTVLAQNTLSHLDKACIKCHAQYQLHQPQAVALGLRPVSREIALVHAGSCSECHREHRGPDTMKLPASNMCQDCHSDAKRLREGITLVKTDGEPPGPKGDVRDFGDGLRRFVPPRPENHQPVAFKSFAQGHPAFGYEQPGLRDPAAIRYNHARHEQPDIPQLHGRELNCADCHKPGADGVFMQPVNYEAHCARCHSLHFDPDVPQLAVPHGDPEKVRIYLRTLATHYSDFAKNQAAVTDKAQLRLYVETQLAKLEARGITNVQELERRVFFTGDPPEDQTRLSVKSNKAQFFGACAKCHDVLPPEGSAAPKIVPPRPAERWLTRGPFTHAKHTHMSCLDCHGAAKTSSKTTDILMPTQSSCIDCHRPLEGEKVDPPKTPFQPGKENPELVQKQRREGGVAENCQSCHPGYHAPSESAVFVTSK